MYINPFLFFIFFSVFSPCKENNYKCWIWFIFYRSYETKAKDDDECNVHCLLLVFLWNQGKRQWWMCLVLVFWFFFLHCKRQWQASGLIVIFYNSRKKQKKHRKQEEDDEPSFHAPQEKNLDVGFSWVAESNNKHLGLSSSFSLSSSLSKDNSQFVVVF